MATEVFDPTESDLSAYSQTPEVDWFDPEATLIHRPRFRCDRLEQAGLLESRVLIDSGYTRKEFKRIRG